MNKTAILIGAVIIIVLGVGAYSAKMQMKKTEAMKIETEKTAMIEKEAMAMKEKEASMATGTDGMMKKDTEGKMMDDGMMKKDDSSMMKKDEMKKDSLMNKSAGTYSAYSADKLALAKDSKVIIFFHASWCPTCRALDAEITAKGVQAGYTILKADYDSSKELKSKYGVTIQHTLVQVNESGASLNKWTGGDLATLYAKTK